MPILVGHHRRHNPLVRRARDTIATRLGTLVGFLTMAAMRKPDSYYAPQWRREAGAGPFLVNLIHEVDLVRFLCGEIVGCKRPPANRNGRGTSKTRQRLSSTCGAAWSAWCSYRVDTVPMELGELG